MRKRMSLLISSGMTVVGLAAGVTPAHAAPKAAEVIIGSAYVFADFRADPIPLESNANCVKIPSPLRLVVSAMNTSASSTITLYRGSLPIIGCYDQVAVLDPGERDSGYLPGTDELSELGMKGAEYYSST